MLKGRMSSRGQIALPKELREQLGLGEGTSVTVRVEEDRTSPSMSLSRCAGQGKAASLTEPPLCPARSAPA
jgi:AbrB family looped-hinge helix DNA binding protein